jgi:hypothetical protein
MSDKGNGKKKVEKKREKRKEPRAEPRLIYDRGEGGGDIKRWKGRTEPLASMVLRRARSPKTSEDRSLGAFDRRESPPPPSPRPEKGYPLSSATSLIRKIPDPTDLDN